MRSPSTVGEVTEGPGARPWRVSPSRTIADILEWDTVRIEGASTRHICQGLERRWLAGSRIKYVWNCRAYRVRQDSRRPGFDAPSSRHEGLAIHLGTLLLAIRLGEGQMAHWGADEPLGDVE